MPVLPCGASFIMEALKVELEKKMKKMKSQHGQRTDERRGLAKLCSNFSSNQLTQRS
jgi:hypothetical protein